MSKTFPPTGGEGGSCGGACISAFHPFAGMTDVQGGIHFYAFPAKAGIQRQKAPPAGLLGPRIREGGTQIKLLKLLLHLPGGASLPRS